MTTCLPTTRPEQSRRVFAFLSAPPTSKPPPGGFVISGVHMLSREQAAKWMVIGWCRDWSMLMLMNQAMATSPADETQDLVQKVKAAHEAFPWLPATIGPYMKGGTVRQYIGGAFPKLSAWMFRQATDADRMRCSAQIEKLRDPGLRNSLRVVSDEDRKEMKDSVRSQKAATAAWRLSRDAFKTNQRSAWNVCKA